MNLPLLAVSTVCQRLNFTDFSSVGTCFVENVLFGDVALAGIIIFILFAALVVRYNFPVTMMIPLGIALGYVLWLMTGAEIFMGMFILALIIGGAVLIIGLMQYLNR